MTHVPYERHIFVCINRRADGHARGCCASKGSEELHGKLKALVKERLPDAMIRVNKSGCLDTCELGISMVVYPDAVWYGHITEADLDDIVESHLKRGVPVERLRLDR